MREFWEQIKENIGVLIGAFGLKPRLSVEEYDRLEALYNADDCQGCVALIGNRFPLHKTRFKVVIHGPWKIRDRLRFTWVDDVFDFFWEKAEKARTSKHKRPIWPGMYHLDKEKNDGESIVVQMEMHFWAKRLPFEVFVALVAREVALMWLQEACSQKAELRMLNNPVYAEILAMIAGFDHAVWNGQYFGRYQFSALDLPDLRVIHEYLKEKRREAGIVSEWERS